jgi:hypothetical protein
MVIYSRTTQKYLSTPTHLLHTKVALFRWPHFISLPISLSTNIMTSTTICNVILGCLTRCNFLVSLEREVSCKKTWNVLCKLIWAMLIVQRNLGKHIWAPWPLFEGECIDSSAFPYTKHINLYYTKHNVTIDTCLDIVKPFSFFDK